MFYIRLQLIKYSILIHTYKKLYIETFVQIALITAL
jgi:hypothetical protein